LVAVGTDAGAQLRLHFLFKALAGEAQAFAQDVGVCEVRVAAVLV
jgi:hypothetical protein